MTKKERGGREKGEGRGAGGGWGGEGSLRERGREGKGVGKRGKEGKFRGARPPKYFFLEPRLVCTCNNSYIVYNVYVQNVVTLKSELRVTGHWNSMALFDRSHTSS